MEVRRIGPDKGFVDAVKRIETSVTNGQTQTNGNSFIRESQYTIDPYTGVATIMGKLPDGSYGFRDFVNDITPPEQPSAPDVSPTLSGAIVSWSGLDAAGNSQPADYSRTIIQYSADGVNWSTGGALYGETTHVVPNLEIGIEYLIRLVSFDTNDNESLPSPSVKCVPTGIIDNSDIADAISKMQEDARQATEASAHAQEAAVNAQEAAEKAAADVADAVNASSTIFSDTAPTDPKATVPTTLWIDTSGSPAKNTPNRWLDGAWVAITDIKAVEAAANAAEAKKSAELSAESARRAQDAAGEALVSANGKNRLVYSTSPAPTGAVPGANDGDTWFQTDNNNVVVGQWTYSGSAYVQATLGHEIFASIDAGKISVGLLDGNIIRGKTISTDKLLITSSDNVIQEPDFSAGGVSWEVTGATSHVSGAGRGGGNVLRFTGAVLNQTALNKQPRLPVDPGSAYSGTMWVKSNAALPAGRVRLVMRCYSSVAAYTDIEIASNPEPLIATNWTEVTGRSTINYGQVPNNTINIQFFIQVINTAAANITDVSYVSAIRKADGRLIVDGAIDGKIVTGALLQSRSEATRGIKLTDTQFVSYNTSNVETFRIDGDTGNVSLIGTIKSGSSIEGATITGGIVQTKVTGKKIVIQNQEYGSDIRFYSPNNSTYAQVLYGTVEEGSGGGTTGTDMLSLKGDQNGTSYLNLQGNGIVTVGSSTLLTSSEHTTEFRTRRRSAAISADDRVLSLMHVAFQLDNQPVPSGAEWGPGMPPFSSGWSNVMSGTRDANGGVITRQVMNKGTRGDNGAGVAPDFCQWATNDVLQFNLSGLYAINWTLVAGLPYPPSAYVYIGKEPNNARMCGIDFKGGVVNIGHPNMRVDAGDKYRFKFYQQSGQSMNFAHLITITRIA